MTEDSAVFRKVADYLLRAAAPKYRTSPVTADTEIYYDLRLYGDDLFELIRWINQEFGFVLELNVAAHAPTEHPFPWLADAFSTMVGRRHKHRYKSLKVRDVVAAIETRRWPVVTGGRD